MTRNPAVFPGVPIRGIAGDQQAALFGQCCFSPGQAKYTYGTGCFLLMNTGHEACESKNGLVTTVAASAPDAKGPEYALEGSVFMAGALLQWLRDEMGLIDDVADTCEIARSVESAEGVYIVPASPASAPLLGRRGARHGRRPHARLDPRPFRPRCARIARLPGA